MNDCSQMTEDELFKVLTDKMDKLSDEYIKLKQQLQDANKVIEQGKQSNYCLDNVLGELIEICEDKHNNIDFDLDWDIKHRDKFYDLHKQYLEKYEVSSER